jgi:exodeoxyribonuclease V beta subunit
MNTQLIFDAKTVRLSGSNLIEASAGTGKTYSIAILALRLLLEQAIPLPQILMVTFTKAAVAELQERVALFIRKAHKASLQQSIDDNTIEQIVQQAVQQTDANTVTQRLQDALLLLDEQNIMTIHSFCQQTLTEFAFETKQQFGVEMFTEVSTLIELALNDYWRKYITTLPQNLLELLGYSTLRSELLKIITEHYNGKHYHAYHFEEESKDIKLSKADYDILLQEVQAIALAQEQLAIESFQENYQDIEAICTQSKAKNKPEFIAALQEAKSFIQLVNSYDNVLTKKLPEAFKKSVLTAGSYIQNAAAITTQLFKSKLIVKAIAIVTKQVEEMMLQQNYLSYNHLIQNLAKALTQTPNPKLEKALQDKYRAVFVDEFQDTDKEQYQIFNTAFGANTTLFYIGDPKQSIYAWRKADLHTYLLAKDQVDHVYEMNINFRSSTPYIAAMNTFFLPEQKFDTFYFLNDTDSINYTPVDSPENNSKGYFSQQGKIDNGIDIIQESKKEHVYQALATQVQQLLQHDDYTLVQKDKSRRIQPNDIGILVRTNSEGKMIKSYLSHLGIQAVVINDARILQTKEALELVYILEAMLNTTTSNIHRALLTSILGVPLEDIKSTNKEALTDCFQSYRVQCQKEGIFSAFAAISKDWNIQQRFINSMNERGLTNFLQLQELLGQIEYRKELNLQEIATWLLKGTNGMATEGDEYEVRLESDEEAVKIVTIHKSKGLEYNIVLSPSLDLTIPTRHAFCNFRNQEGEYITKEALLMTAEEKEWYTIQQEQENRRLLYVAITRAVYKSYVYQITHHYYKHTGLSTIVNILKNQPTKDITVYNGSDIEINNTNPTIQLEQNLYLTHSPIQIEALPWRDLNWQRLSYSKISVHGTILAKEKSSEFDDDYDAFIFSQLKFGAHTGNLLHQIFEDIDFAQSDWWDATITNVLKQYAPNASVDFFNHIRTLVHHVLHTNIDINKINFQLSAIPFYKRIPELEFDFPIQGFHAGALERLQSSDKSIAVNTQYRDIQGIMNGKIDLFFEYQGRYYILDWKSNYLGHRLEDYNKDALLQSMNDNNYHLQYLIYTVAVKKYLEQRLENFDYEKHFGGVIYLFIRGIRHETSSGIFTARPSLNKIQSIERILLQPFIM